MDEAFPGGRVEIRSAGGRFELNFQQHELLRPLTAAELSDGTLRFLLWTAALLTPRPPQLMVLNEPENSLHPDLPPALGRLLAASQESQLVVVSHSDALIQSPKGSDDRNALHLEKSFGETHLHGQTPQSAPLGLAFPIVADFPSRPVKSFREQTPLPERPFFEAPMNKLATFLATLTLAALTAVTLPAQTIVGSWQGTLNAGGKDLRIIIKIATTEADALKATVYSIDQTPQPIPGGTVSYQGGAIKIPIPAVGGSYEGKLSADKNSFEGKWAQGPNPLPLTLTRATKETAWEIPAPPPPPKKMAADANPSFEVASIKLSQPNSPGQMLTLQGRRIVTRNTPLSFLITFAYGVHPKQLIGGPSWLETERFDITAEPDAEGQPNDKQIKLMIQKLLADRFQLKFHKEQKELSAYAITVGKTGAKLVKSQGDPNGLPGLGFRGLGKLVVQNANIPDFAGLMQSVVLDRPVVDKTGLSERFDFTLDWTPEASQFGGRGGQAPTPAPADDASAPPDLFTAIVQQLGLKLDSTKLPVDVLVIDKAEKPSEN